MEITKIPQNEEEFKKYCEDRGYRYLGEGRRA